MEHIDLKDFDIMGVFTLKDVAGIENMLLKYQVMNICLVLESIISKKISQSCLMIETC